ncbi:hypothetical protein Purlil1_1985 [Purpureocillium lilacinum]|uniref:Uncharacterized protein n=1 Tax=Purpureocillium lilacinum TaxID=33203 RepID=A0ABR0CC70_PURLI|nr:hypothetical protein Purlil1_1985 [Purpureocillium lilacinum]
MRPCLGGFAGFPSPRGPPWWVRQRVGPTRFARWTEEAEAPLSTAGSTPEAGGKPPPGLPYLLGHDTENLEGTHRQLRRMSSAVQHHAQSSSVLTGSGALVARLQCKSVRHVQATHRRQARRISAARPLIRSDWNQARPPRGLRPASPSFVPRPRTGCTPLHLVRAADGAALASSLMPDPGGVGNGQASPAPATKNRPRHTSSPDLHINDAAPAVAFSGETLRRVRCGRAPSSPRKEKIANSPALSGRLLSVSAHIVLPSEPLKPAPPASFFVSVVVRPRARRQSVDSPAERPAVNAPRPLLHRHCITARSRHRLTSDQADDLPPV